MTQGDRNPHGCGVVGATHNTNPHEGKLEGWGNPQGVSEPHPRTPIEKITSNILGSPYRVEYTTDTFIGSPSSESLDPEKQGFPENLVEEINLSIE